MTKRGTALGSTFHRHPKRLAQYAAPFHHDFCACFHFLLQQAAVPGGSRFRASHRQRHLIVGTRRASEDMHLHCSEYAGELLTGSTHHKRSLLHNKASQELHKQHSACANTCGYQVHAFYIRAVFILSLRSDSSGTPAR